MSWSGNTNGNLPLNGRKAIPERESKDMKKWHGIFSEL